MHAYSKAHVPMGAIPACCCQSHLQLGVPLPWEPMVGVLFSQKSTLGVLLPQEPMNMFGQLGKNLLQGRKADQEDASRPGLVQLSSILLHSWCLISGDR